VQVGPIRKARACDLCGDVAMARWDGNTIDEDNSEVINAKDVAYHKARECAPVPW
jgi:hypothetical protein